MIDMCSIELRSIFCICNYGRCRSDGRYMCDICSMDGRSMFGRCAIYVGLCSIDVRYEFDRCGVDGR